MSKNFSAFLCTKKQLLACRHHFQIPGRVKMHSLPAPMVSLHVTLNLSTATHLHLTCTYNLQSWHDEFAFLFALVELFHSFIIRDTSPINIAHQGRIQMFLIWGVKLQVEKVWQRNVKLSTEMYSNEGLSVYPSPNDDQICHWTRAVRDPTSH